MSCNVGEVTKRLENELLCCYIGEAKEGLENELSRRRSDGKVGE